MKLTQLLSANFFVSEEMSKEVCHIESLANEDFDYANEYGTSDTASNYKKIIELQKKTADRKGHMTIGFDSLMKNMSSLDDSRVISMRMIDSENWGGRLYFLRDKHLLGVFLGKKRNAKWQTPPNWDGSQKELDEYNRHLTDSE